MSSERTTLYTCDRCKKKEVARSGAGYEEDKPPLGWSDVRLTKDHFAELSKDLCGDCTTKLRGILDLFMKKPLS
jgi:hypothetical protein